MKVLSWQTKNEIAVITKLLARTFDRDRDAEVLLQSCEDRIAGECSKRLNDVAHSIDGLEADWRKTLHKSTAFIRHVSEGREALRAIRSNKPGADDQSVIPTVRRVTLSRFMFPAPSHIRGSHHRNRHVGRSRI